MQFKNGTSGFSTNNSDMTIKINNNTVGNEWLQVDGNFTIIYTVKAIKGKASISLSFNKSWDQKDLSKVTFTNISISGDVDPCIVSSNGKDICLGEENTFTAIGLSGNITWTMNGRTLGTGTSYTGTFLEGGIIKASNGTGTPLSFEFTTSLCCALNADRKDVHIQSFDMPNTSLDYCEVEDLVDENGNNFDITTSYDFSYQQFRQDFL
jgi:hypothetical protein